MSIDKMKKLILMIESNNFNLDEYTTDPSRGNLNLSSKEYDALINSKDAEKNLKTLSKAYNAASDNEDLFRKAFSNKKINVNIDNSNKIIKDLELSIADDVTEIYRLLKKHNILSGDIDPNTFKANSYRLFTPKGGSEPTGLMSNDAHDIYLFFKDKTLNKLETMTYRLRIGYSNQDISAFISEVNSNTFKQANNIRTASMVRSNNNKIDIFFN